MRRRSSVAWMVALFPSVLAGCGHDDLARDEDLGPIDQIVGAADRVSWPGIDRAGVREVPLVHAFADHAPADYWFLGYASPETSDSYWLCREGDTACPLDEHRRIAWDRLVGDPVFATVPAQAGYSPFSRMWKVTVGASFEADYGKSVGTLQALADSDAVRFEPVVLDFGDAGGINGVVAHVPLILTGTELERNGTTLADLETPMLPVTRAHGWYANYRVELLDLTASEAVFPAGTSGGDPAAMPASPFYTLWRDCGAEAPSTLCDSAAADQVVVRGQTTSDTNDVLAALPCAEPPGATEWRYSPLFALEQVVVVPEHDGDVILVDTSADRSQSDVTSVDDILSMVDAGWLAAPIPQRVDGAGNPLPGGSDRLYYHGAVPVAETFVPYPCAAAP